MTPWFRDFKGAVTQTAPDRYKFSGIIKQSGENEIDITELPIRMWTQDFKNKLVEILKAEKGPSFIKDYDDYNTHTDVHFVIKMEDKHMKAALEEGLEEKFKLSKSIATSNLVAFDAEGRISKYATVEDILKEFYTVRIKFYEKRKVSLGQVGLWVRTSVMLILSCQALMLSEMHRDLDRYTNQARFVQMIIDSKLVVSKKKKQVLVQELQEKGFKAFPKILDASKSGETEPIADNDEEEEEEVAGSVGAAAYDYLLGMPIWSLTKERIERLLRQVGEVEEAIDKLIKCSKEDLWKSDLTEFIEEWRFQLEDQRKTKKKVLNTGRRGSKKLHVGAGAAGRKRKNDEDDDFDAAPKAKKTSAPKAKGGMLGDYLGLGAAKAETAPKSKGPSAAAKKAQQLLDLVSTKADGASQKPKEEDDDLWMNLDQVDGAGAAAPKPSKKAAAPFKKAAVPKPAPSKMSQLDDDESADEDVPRANAGRKPRAAATKPIKYDISDSDGDDMLFDVGNMVKGIKTDATSMEASRPLFSASMSRPGSSAGFSKRPTSSQRQTIDPDVDDTDYSKLAPPTTKKGPPVTARHTILSDEDDDIDSLDEPPMPKISKVKAAVAKPVPKPKPKPKTFTKKPAAAASLAAPKPLPLSPAGKAYAAKKAKAEAAAKKAEKDDLDVDGMADEILDDEDDDEDVAPAVRRPARRAAAAAPTKKWVVSDDDDEDEEDDEDDEESDGFDGGDSDD